MIDPVIFTIGNLDFPALVWRDCDVRCDRWFVDGRT